MTHKNVCFFSPNKINIKNLMSSNFTNGYTGFHSYTYVKDAYICQGADAGCKNVSGSHPNNYFSCSKCQEEASLRSLSMTLRSDDVQRYESQLRLKLNDPLPLHREVKKLHKKFKAKGGKIKVINIPTIVMGPGGKTVATIKYT